MLPLEISRNYIILVEVLVDTMFSYTALRVDYYNFNFSTEVT